MLEHSRENTIWDFIALKSFIAMSFILRGFLWPLAQQNNTFKYISFFFIFYGSPAIPKQGSFPFIVHNNRVHLYQYFWSAFSLTMYPGYKDLILKICLPATEATPAF